MCCDYYKLYCQINIKKKKNYFKILNTYSNKRIVLYIRSSPLGTQLASTPDKIMYRAGIGVLYTV